MELQTYNNDTTATDELFQLMKAQMSTDQEQIFMTSHYLYLQHGSDNTKFVVDFDTVWKSVDFSRRDNAKKLLEKHFIQHIDYNKLAPFSEGAILGAPSNCGAAPLLGGAAFSNKNLGGSGLNKENILLTVDCFKNFCMLASTPKAKEIRSYYVKMENIMHEYYKNFKSRNNELQNTLSVYQNSLQTTQTALQKSIRETAVKRHEVLIESNKNKWVVYFCRVKLHEDGSFILKIGETTNIKNRIDALRCDFDPSLIVLDVFICENSIRFEKSLHNHPEILKYKYAKLEHKNKKYSTEAYHIPNQKEYENIVKMVNIEIRKYNSIEFSRLLIEEKKIDLVKSLIPICKNYDEIMNIINKISSPVVIDTDLSVNHLVNHLPDQEDADTHIENVDLVETVASEITSDEAEPENDIVITANSNGPIVQIYHKDDLTQVVQVYDSIMEATRNFNYNNKTAS